MITVVGKMIDYMLDECKDRTCSVSLGSTCSHVESFISKNGMQIWECL
jgi:hypothetical protein